MKKEVMAATARPMPRSQLHITASILIRCLMQSAVSPTSVAMAVAISMGMKTSVGLAAPPWARYIMMLMGIRQSPDELSTRNIIMASVAVSFLGLSFCISCMARSPMGVAALSRPSILAEMFMKIAPMAGCPLGIPGKRREKKGLMRCPKNSMTPAFSPIFMMPSQRVSTPVRPSEISKAKAAWEKELFMMSVHTARSPVARLLPAAVRKATAKNAIQIQLSAMM